MNRLQLLAGCSLLTLPSCVERRSYRSPESNDQPIVYAAPSRVEVYEASSTSQALAALSTAAIVPSAALSTSTSSERVELRVATLGASVQLCESANYRSQPAAAKCTAVLVERDLVLTAGHCFRAASACQSSAIVFDYYYRSQDVLEPIHVPDVFGCKKIIARSEDFDFAWVQLDRPAYDRKPVSLSAGLPSPDLPIVVIGTPHGLPIKADEEGTVVDVAHSTTFSLRADAAEGSSGSGVFADGELIGVLTRGGADFEQLGDAGCLTERVVPEEDLTVREQATQATAAVRALCASGWVSEKLCPKATVQDAGCSGECCDEAACAPEPVVDAAVQDGEPQEPHTRAQKGCQVVGHRATAPTGEALLLGLLLLGLLRRRSVPRPCEKC